MSRMIMARYHGDLGSRLVDHIDGDRLNNQKYNLRLTNASGNARNKHYQPKTVALDIPYKGVTRKGKRYHVNVTVNSEQIYGGAFGDMRDAAIAYNMLAKQWHGEFACLNDLDATDLEITRVRGLMACPKKLRGVSVYRGVTRNRGQWTARITKDDVKLHLGYFNTEEEAAIAYDLKAKELYGEFAWVNFTQPNPDVLQRVLEFLASPKRYRGAASPYYGVSPVGVRWQAYVWHDGQRFRLGRFSDEEVAARAVDAKLTELGSNHRRNFPS